MILVPSRDALSAGLHFDVPINVYFGDPCPEPSLTQSVAKILIDRSPAHARAAHPRLSPPPEPGEDEPAEKYVAAQAIGNMVHAFLLGRGKAIAIGEYPDWRTKEAKQFRDEKSSAGLSVILAKHAIEATRIIEGAREQLNDIGWRGIGEGLGNAEVVAIWNEGPIWLRTLIDWLTLDHCLIYDVKTVSRSAAPQNLPMMMVSDGWHVQAAFHERGLDALDPATAGRRKHRFIVIEQEPPYALVPVELTEASMTMGGKQLDYAVRSWREAIETGDWPAYGANVCRPEFPPWQEQRWLDREISDAAKERMPTKNVLMAG